MPLVVAVVPDLDQASTVSSILGALDGVELLLSESGSALLARLGERTPDLVLLSPLAPPSHEALIAAALRERGTHAAHVQIVTIPLLAAVEPAGRASRLFSSFGSTPPPPVASGCPPDTFLDQVRTYLDLASAERRRLDAIAARRQREPLEPEDRAAPEDAA